MTKRKRSSPPDAAPGLTGIVAEFEAAGVVSKPNAIQIPCGSGTLAVHLPPALELAKARRYVAHFHVHAAMKLLYSEPALAQAFVLRAYAVMMAGQTVGRFERAARLVTLRVLLEGAHCMLHGGDPDDSVRIVLLGAVESAGLRRRPADRGRKDRRRA